MKLISSNKSKIKEFKRILGNELSIETGKDLPEVDGTMDEVIIYKSLLAGKGFIVEDTILKIDGKEVVDIKWNQSDKLKNTQKIEWIVSLGYNNGENIYISRGIINGIVVEPSSTECFGFDGYILPDGSDLTLCELEKINQKDKFSARYIALLNFKNNKFLKKLSISDISKWEGAYQNS